MEATKSENLHSLNGECSTMDTGANTDTANEKELLSKESGGNSTVAVENTVNDNRDSDKQAVGIEKAIQDTAESASENNLDENTNKNVTDPITDDAAVEVKTDKGEKEPKDTTEVIDIDRGSETKESNDGKVASKSDNIAKETEEVIEIDSDNGTKKSNEVQEADNSESIPKQVNDTTDMDYREKSGVVEGTSDSDSDSSSDDEAKTEQGKTVDTSTQINKILSQQRDQSPDCEKRVKLNRHGFEDIRTKGELLPEELPPLEELTITVDESVEMVEVGAVKSVVGVLVIIQSNETVKPLDEETILFLDGHTVLGQVFEVFGPVKTPWYSVRFNESTNIAGKGIKEGMKVYCAPREDSFTKFVFVDNIRQTKGSDASWENNNEPPEKHLDYSDDESEKRAKAKRRNKKTGDTHDTDEQAGTDAAKKNRRNRNRSGPQSNGQSDFQHRPPYQNQGRGTDRNPFQGDNQFNFRNNHNGPRFNRNPNMNGQPRFQQWPPGRGHNSQRFGGPPNFQNGSRFRPSQQQQNNFNQMPNGLPPNQNNIGQNNQMNNRGQNQRFNVPPLQFVPNSTPPPPSQLGGNSFSQGGFSGPPDVTRPPPPFSTTGLSVPPVVQGDNVRMPPPNLATFPNGQGLLQTGALQQTFQNLCNNNMPMNARMPISQQGTANLNNPGALFSGSSNVQRFPNNPQSNVAFAGQMMFQNQVQAALGLQGAGNILGQGNLVGQGHNNLGQGFLNASNSLPSQVQGQVGISMQGQGLLNSHGSVQGQMMGQGQLGGFIASQGHIGNQGQLGQSVGVHALPVVRQMQTPPLQGQTVINPAFSGISSTGFAPPIVDNRLVQNSQNQ